MGAEEVRNSRSGPGLSGVVLVLVLARPGEGTGGLWSRDTQKQCVPKPRAPTEVSGVPATARSPSPAPAAPSGRAPRQLSMPGSVPSGGMLCDTLRDPHRVDLQALKEIKGVWRPSKIKLCKGHWLGAAQKKSCGHGVGDPGERNPSRLISNPRGRPPLPARQHAGWGTGRSQRKSPENNFWEEKGPPIRASSGSGRRDRRVLRNGTGHLPRASAPRGQLRVGTSRQRHHQPLAPSLPPCPLRPRATPGFLAQVRRRRPPARRPRRTLGAGPWRVREHASSSHAGGRARSINFLHRTLSSAQKPPPRPQQFPQKRAAPRPAYLAWCWLPAPRSHEAGSPGTAPPKSRLSTRGGGSRRSSAPPGTPYLRGGSAGRGSAGCPSPGAPLPSGRSAPARPLRSPCGGRLGRGAAAGG